MTRRKSPNSYLYECFIDNRPTIGEIKNNLYDMGWGVDEAPNKISFVFGLGMTTKQGIIVDHPTHTTKYHPDLEEAWLGRHFKTAERMLKDNRYDHLLPREFFKLFINHIREPIPNVIVDHWSEMGVNLIGILRE